MRGKGWKTWIVVSQYALFALATCRAPFSIPHFTTAHLISRPVSPYMHTCTIPFFSEARTPSSLLWLTFDELVFLLAFFVACFRVGITSDASLDLLGGITLQTSEDDVRRKSSGSLHMNTTDPAAAAAIRIFYG